MKIIFKIVLIWNSIFLFVYADIYFNEIYVDYDVLDKNLFGILKLHPKLHSVGNKLTEQENQLIEKYVDDYLELNSVKSFEKQQQKLSRSKRDLDIATSYPVDEFGTFMLSRVEFLDGLQIYNTSKFEYFEQSNKWFFVTIQRAAIGNLKLLNYTNLYIWRIENYTYSRVPHWILHRAEEFFIHSVRNTTYIIAKASDEYYSGVWSFDGLELTHVQNMDMENVIDVEIWEVGSQMHMAISGLGFRQNELDLNETKNFNTTFVYKWSKYFFDRFQVIERLANRVIAFTADDFNYLLLNINHTTSDISEEFLEIYRYNLANDQYEVYQRIPTYNCRDVKFFRIKNFEGYDNFLFAANYISGEDLDELPPIIYKYVDGYFLPFQNLYIENVMEIQTLYLPDNAIFLLLIRTEYQGLKTYQYDGWIFQETPYDINTDLTEAKVANAKFGVIENNKNVLVLGIGEDMGKNSLQLYGIDFVYENDVSDFREETIRWCETSGKKLNRRLRQKRQINSEDNQTSTITNDELVGKIVLATSMLKDLEQKTANSLQYEGPHVVQDLIAEKIVMKDPNIRFLSTENLNDQDINDLLDNLIHINVDDQWPESLILERAQIDAQIQPEKINGKDINTVITTNDNLSLKKLIIDGETIFLEPVITNTLNSIPFDEDHVIMKDSNQHFTKLDIQNAKVTNLTVDKMSDLKEKKDEMQPIEKISKLAAESVTIGGLLNGISMETLDKYALRSTGDQTLTEKYFFEDLYVEEIVGEMLNDELVEDLVRIDSGTYRLDTIVEFEKPLSVNNLSVMSFLDSIPVSRGKLLVLLKDNPSVQYVKGEKTFDNVEVLSQIFLQGKPEGDGVEKKFNPTVHVDGPLVITGDFVISGNTTIEKFLRAQDIRSADGNRSVKRVLSHGIPLTEKQIDLRLNFNQQLIVDDVRVDKINGVDPNSWVVTGTRELQIIRAPKVFLNDMNITGSTDFYRINNILISDLENAILRRTGDQVISGRHTIMNVVANRVFGNNTIIGNNTWKNILTTGTKQVISGTTLINSDVDALSTKAQTAHFNGTINGYNFTEITQDTVTINSKKQIFGHKTFENLTAINLNVANMDLTRKRIFTMDGDVDLENARVENLHFTKTCNEMEIGKFMEQSKSDATSTVSDLTDFEDLTVLGDVYVESNRLGDMDLGSFQNDTVKVDEEHVFGSVVVGNTLISEAKIELHGDIEKVDLENLVKPNSEELITVSDETKFLNNLTIHGTAFLEESMEDLDMVGLCKFSNVNEEPKRMDLTGNVVFVKGPKMSNIMNETLKSILEHAWFKNKEMRVAQNITFQNITFRTNVTVTGLVDGVDLRLLEKEYFSKSKDQTITGGLYFANKVIFAKNLNCPEVTMNRNGEVNGLKIQELPRTILLQDTDQLFEDVAYFEDIRVDDLEGDFSVNDYNLDTDLMIYDKENVVTGTKRLNTLIVGNLELKQNSTIQGVDLLDWIQEAVLKKGTFTIEKRKILHGNVHFDRPISIIGNLNGEMFTNETIMLKSVPQMVTGVKTFESRSTAPMKLKNVKLKGLLNDMQMSDLMDDQSGSGDMILKSPVHFYNDIFTKNINLKTFKGVQIEKFLSDIKKLDKSDMAEKYAKLLNMTTRINRNLRVTPFYFSFYKSIQEIEKPIYITNSCCDNPTLLYIDYINGSYMLCYYYWDQDLNLFQNGVVSAVNLGYPAIKTMSFSLDRKQFLYLEYPPEEHPPEGLLRGQFWRVENLNHLIDYGSIKSNGILQVTPLRLKESDCILVIYENFKSPHIFCDFNLGYMRLIQDLPPARYIQSEYLMIDGRAFLILLKSNEKNTESSPAGVEIWCLHEDLFGVRQVLHFSDPKSISAVEFRGHHYLSISYSGGIQSYITILRYSRLSGNFEDLQIITLSNLVKAEFGILPSGELFFFLLGPSRESLSIYKYLGVSGFREEMTLPSSKDIYNFKQFALGKKHFVMIYTQDKLEILKAEFRGNTDESL